MDKIKQFLHGLSQSHRSHHIAGGFLLGLFFGFLTVAVAAGAMEFKDCQHDRKNAGLMPWKRGWTWACWDWADFWLTVGGGMVGGGLVVLVLAVFGK